VYLGVVQRVLVLLAFVGMCPACAPVSVASTPRSPTVATPLTAPSAAKPALASASVSACHAAPATVYGDEAVVFEIAAASPAPAAVELLDQQGRTLVQGQVAVPGQWRPPGLPSGDFQLQAGSNRVSCSVTVNRELSRGSQAP
jgi:hypothetical protein